MLRSLQASGHSPTYPYRFYCRLLTCAMRKRVSWGAALGMLVGTAVFAEPSPGTGVPFIENKRQWPAGFLYGAGFKSARVYLDTKRLFFVQFTQSPDGKKETPKLRTDFSES